MTEKPSLKQDVAAGASIGAAVLLTAVGLLEVFQGISAVASDTVFVVGIEYVYEFTLTAWGWVHIVLGVLMILVGIGLFTGASWARLCAVIIAALSILGNFLWLPYNPWWSVLVIAIDIVVIWAVSTWSPDRSR